MNQFNINVSTGDIISRTISENIFGISINCLLCTGILWICQIRQYSSSGKWGYMNNSYKFDPFKNQDVRKSKVILFGTYFVGTSFLLYFLFKDFHNSGNDILPFTTFLIIFLVITTFAIIGIYKYTKYFLKNE